MEIDDARPPHLPPCPSCGRTDRTAAVPAVYQAGRQQVTEVIPATDDDPRRTVTREVRSPLATALAPAPVQRRSAGPGCAIFLLIAGGMIFAFKLLVNDASDRFTAGQSADPVFANDPAFAHNPAFAHTDPSFGRPDVSFLGWIAAFAVIVAVILLATYARRRAAFQRQTAGRAAAEQLWARAWYCERCGTVHFPAAPGVPSRPIGLQEFRTMVWDAGGYGHLARQHPVV